MRVTSSADTAYLAAASAPPPEAPPAPEAAPASAAFVSPNHLAFRAELRSATVSASADAASRRTATYPRRPRVHS